LANSAINAYDEYILSKDSFLKSGRQEFKRLLTKGQRNVFEFTFEPTSDCFVTQVSFGYLMGKGGIGIKASNNTFNTLYRDDWIFRDLSSIEVFLNDQILVDSDGDAVFDLQNTKYMPGRPRHDVLGVSIHDKVTTTYREDVLLPIKCNMMEEKPMLMLAGSKLRFKFICEYASTNFIMLRNPDDVLTNELESLTSILTVLYDEPFEEFDKNISYIDKTYFFHSQKYAEIPVTKLGVKQNIALSSLRYGNLIAILLSLTGDNASRTNGSRINYPQGVEIQLSTKGGLHTITHGNKDVNRNDKSKRVFRTPFTSNFSEFCGRKKKRLYNKTTTTKTLGQIGFNIEPLDFLKKMYEREFETLAAIMPRTSYIVETHTTQTHI